MARFRIGFDAISIDPRHSRRHHTKIQVIGYRMGVACLAFGATDVLFNFFIAGFDFPAGAVEFDNLLGGQRPVGGEESDPSTFPEDLYDTDLATQVFQHYALIIGEHVALLAIENLY